MVRDPLNDLWELVDREEFTGTVIHRFGENAGLDVLDDLRRAICVKRGMTVDQFDRWWSEVLAGRGE